MSFKSAIYNYNVLHNLWEESIDLDQASDLAIKARIIGIEARFKTFRASATKEVKSA